jgi:hypothetical protein
VAKNRKAITKIQSRLRDLWKREEALLKKLQDLWNKELDIKLDLFPRATLQAETKLFNPEKVDEEVITLNSLEPGGEGMSRTIQVTIDIYEDGIGPDYHIAEGWIRAGAEEDKSKLPRQAYTLAAQAMKSIVKFYDHLGLDPGMNLSRIHDLEADVRMQLRFRRDANRLEQP